MKQVKQTSNDLLVKSTNKQNSHGPAGISCEINENVSVSFT